MYESSPSGKPVSPSFPGGTAKSARRDEARQLKVITLRWNSGHEGIYCNEADAERAAGRYSISACNFAARKCGEYCYRAMMSLRRLLSRLGSFRVFEEAVISFSLSTR